MADGIVLIDKPQGFTSFDAVAVMRGTLHERKIGHTGTLDPMATGVLPLLVGKATKLCDIMPVKDKRYTAEIKLGLTTDTLDVWGKQKTDVDCDISEEQFREVLTRFVGEILQTPPMFSAISKNGVRLYDLARQGIEVEREKRPVTVYSIDFIEKTAKNTFSVEVFCSAGTYIRTLADDIGRELNVGGCMSALRRISACGYGVERCIPLEKAREMTAEQLILPIETAVESFPAVRVSPAQAKRFSNGGQLSLDRLKLPENPKGIFAVKDGGKTVGLGEVCAEKGLLNIKCLF